MPAYERLESRRLLAGDVRVRFEFTDLAGTPVSSLQAGDDFLLRAYVRDIRTSPAPTGLFQVFLDVKYGADLGAELDPDVASPTGPISPGPAYAAGAAHGSTSTAGLLDEAGGLDTDFLSPDPANAELLLFSVPFQATEEGDFTLRLEQATNATIRFDEPIAVTVDRIDVVGGSIDITSAGIRVSPTSGLTTTEAGGQDSFEVSLGRQPTANVTIGLSSSDTGEGTISPASLTFTPANWGTPQVVTVHGVDDFQADGNVAYQIVTAPATSSDPYYNGLNANDVAVTNLDNDAVGIQVQPTSGQTTEAGGTASFQIVLTSQPTANVTIGLSSSDTGEGTVSPSSVTFTSANWNSPQTVIVTGQDDPQADGNTAYTIVTSAATSGDSQYNGRVVADVSLTNLDNDTAGVTVAPTVGQTTEAGGTASFEIRLTSQPTADVTIGLSSGDLSEGVVSTSSVTFTPATWNTARQITVTGQDDAAVDGNVAYTIVTAPAVSSDANYSNWNAADMSLTNLDNDSAGIVVDASGALETTEAGTTAQFAVRLTSQPAASVTIGLSSSDTSEGTVSPSSLTFTAANWNQPQTVVVHGEDDPQDDGDVAYQIVTAAATSGDPNYNGRDADDPLVTNRDDDEAGLLIVAASPLATGEWGQAASFSVALRSQPTAAVTVNIGSSDTSEGTVGPATLSFTATNWATPQSVTVTGVDDAAVDGDVSYAITIATASSDPNYGLLAEELPAVNFDNDAPGISVTPLAGLETSENGGTATFEVRLSTQPTANVTIGLSSSDTGEGTVSPASLTFTPADWDTPQVVTVAGTDDAVIDGAVAYQVTVAVAASDDANYAGLAPEFVSVLNRDDDVPGITIAAEDGATTSEAGGVAVLSVVLAAQPNADVTVQLASSDETEGILLASSLLFTPANWNIPQPVTVAGVDDVVVDGDVVYNIVATAVSSDANYDGFAAEAFALLNVENDSAQLTVSAASTSLLEGTGQPNGFVTFDVRLTGDVEGGFTLAYEVNDGTATVASSDYVDADAGIDFAGSDGEVHSISVEVNADDVLEPDETFHVTLAGLSDISASAAANISLAGVPLTFMILDDEAPTISLSDASFTEGTGGGTTTFNFAVEVSNPVQGGLRIHYTINDGTATLADGDYVDNDGVLDLVGGVGEGQSIEVQVNRDAKVERDETFVVRIEEFIFLDPALAAVIEVEPASLTGTIINDDTATIAFVDGSSVAIETAGSHAVPIRLYVSGGGTLGEDVTLDIALLPGNTATTPEDFVLANAAVTFPAGSADGDIALVEIAVVSDDVAESDETFALGLTIQDDGIDDQVSVTEPAQHQVMITEDPLTASISGRVWLDANNDGRQDAGEIGIPGVDVVLSGTDRQGQSVMIVSMTGGDGVYRFDALPAGTYTVRETQPAAFVDGMDSPGTIDGISAGVSSNDEFSNLTLAPDQQAADYSFGERRLARAPASRRFFLASTPPLEQVIRDVVARGEELAGSAARADAIRGGLATEVRRIGPQVTVTGSSGKDTIVVIPAGSSQSSSATKHLVVVNGREWEFAAQDVHRIVVNGSDGDDVVEVHDSPGDDLLVASHDAAILTTEDLRIEAMSMELLRAISTTGGKDEVREEAIDFVLQLDGAWTT